AIEALPAHEFWLRKVLRVQATRLTRGPTLHFACVHIERIDIRRGACGCHTEAEILVILVPPQSADEARGELGSRLLLTPCGIKQMQDTQTILIGDKSDHLAILREAELIHIPWDMISEKGVLLGRQVNIRQPLKFRGTVSGDVQTLAIFAE